MRPTPGASNLTISIGIVDAPVALYSTVNDREDKVTFCEIGPDGQRTKRPTVAGSSVVLDAKGEKVIAVNQTDALQTGEIRKGFVMSEDEIVILEQDEINALLPEKSTAIKISSIVSFDEIDPLMFNVTYYVGIATKAGDEDLAASRYHLVSAMLGDSAGIGDLVLRGKHQAVAVYNRDGRLMLTTLHTANAINPAPVIEGEADTDLVEAAANLVESLRGSFDPTAFRNEFKDAVLDLVRAKASGETIPVVSRKSKTEVSKDALLANLKAVQPQQTKSKKKAGV